jgi:hypothetical protein
MLLSVHSPKNSSVEMLNTAAGARLIDEVRLAENNRFEFVQHVLLSVARKDDDIR